MGAFISFLVALICGGIVLHLAETKGYNNLTPNATLSNFIWFALGFFFSVVSIIVLLILPNKRLHG